MPVAIRVQAVFQGGSGLPEDRFVNTFHFASATNQPYAENALACRNAVEGFFVSPHGGEAAIGAHLSPYVGRAFTVTSYNLLDAPGERLPTTQAATLPASTADGLPEEVAICLTLRGAPPVTPRRRGRIYIGPLCDNNGIIVYANTTTPARPKMTSSASITAALGASFTYLKNVVTADTAWCIRSTTPTENFVPIVDGYVDNAFDTQRRRGPDPDFRFFTS